MPAQLHLPTVLVLYKTALLAGALSTLHVRHRAVRPRGLALLATAFLLLAFGSALAGMGEYEAVPYWLWTHLSLLMGTAGYALYWAGMRGLSGRRRIRAVWVAAVPIAWLVLGLATQFPLENLPRAAAFHLTAALALVASVWEVLRDHRREPLPSRWPLAALLCLSAAIYATRLFYIVNDAATADGFALAFYIQILCHFGIALMIATLSKERAEARLEQAAQTDPLTGLGNRRWFVSRLPADLPPGSALALLDLDLFKQINDRFGHAAGDRVLVEFARNAAGQLRDYDLLARFGGEEFVLYLPTVAEKEATAVAERLRASTQALQIREGSTAITVSVSLGLAWIDRAGTPLDDWLRAADAALYEAKSQGRNRVVRAAPPAQRSLPASAGR